MLNDRDLSALRQIGCHGAAHLQPDLIAVAADKAGAACGIDVRVDRNDADPGSDGFIRCFRAAVIVRGREDHDVRLIRCHLPDQLDLLVNVNFARRGQDLQLDAVFLRRLFNAGQERSPELSDLCHGFQNQRHPQRLLCCHAARKIQEQTEHQEKNGAFFNPPHGCLPPFHVQWAARA